MKKFSDEQIISYLLDINIFHVSFFAKYIPSMQILKNDATIQLTDIKDDTFNMVLYAKFKENNADQKIEEITTLFTDKKLPFSWWLCEKIDTPKDLKNRLINKNYYLKETNIGMYLKLDKHQPQTEKELQIKRVSNIDEFKDFDKIHINSNGNELAFDKLFSNIPKHIYANSDDYRLYIGHIDDMPVVTGILAIKKPVVGIYYIVTDPEHRRKGYATQMMNFLLNQAKISHCEIALLQASQMGEKVYKKMGFLTCCELLEFAYKQD
jgi:GNAT superfamily N-acetyltransferase